MFENFSQVLRSVLFVAVGNIFVFQYICFGTVLPYFSVLGMSKSLVSLSWVPAPIVGILIVPSVARMSDQCQNAKFGKRIPFIVVGCLITTLAVTAMPWAAAMRDQQQMIVAAFLLYMLINIGSNIMNAVGRALAHEHATDAIERMKVNYTFVGFAGMIGPFAGPVLAVKWNDLLPSLAESLPVGAQQLGCTLLVEAFVVFLLGFLGASSGEGKQQEESTPQLPRRKSFSDRALQGSGFPLEAVQKDPRLGRYLFFLWCSTTLGWISIFILALQMPNFMGEKLVHGDAHAPPGSPAQQRYLDGSTRLMGIYMALSGVLQVIILVPLYKSAVYMLKAGCKVQYYGWLLVIDSLIVLAIPFVTPFSLIGVMALLVIHGIFLGEIRFLLLFDLVTDDERLMSSLAGVLAFVNTANCCGQVLGSLIGAWIVAAYPGYDVVFFATAGTGLLSGLLLVLAGFYTSPLKGLSNKTEKLLEDQ